MFQAQSIQGSNPSGKPILSILAKKTYSIEHGSIASDSQEQIPFAISDTYDDEECPHFAEVIAETDLVAFKSSTDFVVLGNARCPRGKHAHYLDCEVTAGPYKKSVRVFGNRTLQVRKLKGLALSDPEPFTVMPLGYRHAYGGVTTSKDGTFYSFYPNPIGKGFTLKGAVEDASQVKIPNIEDPSSPLSGEDMILSKFSDWNDLPAPVSLGWTRKNFFPRYTHCGILPEHLEGAVQNMEEVSKTNAVFNGIKIPSMDFRFYQGASNGLWGKRLLGNEKIQLTNMDETCPVFQTALPAEKPAVAIDMGQGWIELEPELDTVVVYKEKNLLTVLWRATMEFKEREELARLEKLEWKVEGSGG